MNASKEEAMKAIAKLDEIKLSSSSSSADAEDWDAVYEFLNKAYNKLPSEASYAKAKAKKEAK